jgi:signal transduction histidine kinase
METTPHTAGMEPVDVAVMARNAVDRFVAVAEAQHQQLGLRTHGESAVITASPEWLDHLIGVLIDNACKYTPPDGSISVTVSAEGNTVRLTVDDSGPGIPEAARGRIFDRFQRASEQPGGSGLGLAIANAVVRATNGKWQVGTSPQGGASMAVTWPRQLARAATRRAAASRETPPLASLDV